MRCRKPSRRDAGLCRDSDAKRRRQLRFLSRERDGIERGRFAASEHPEIGEDFAGSLHGRMSQLAQPSYAGLTRVSIILQKNFLKLMDGRVKPGHDEVEVVVP
jgi:hypothetical protein